MADFYAILGVPPNATIEQIKDRYRFLAHAYHPDKFPSAGHKAQASEAFKGINEAFQILSDARLRSAYDRQRVVGSAPPKPPPTKRAASPPPPPTPQPTPEPTPPSEPAPSRPESGISLKAKVIVAVLVGVVIVSLSKPGTPKPGTSGSQASNSERKAPGVKTWEPLEVPSARTKTVDAQLRKPIEDESWKNAPVVKWEKIDRPAPAAKPLEGTGKELTEPLPQSSTPESVPLPKSALQKKVESLFDREVNAGIRAAQFRHTEQSQRNAVAKYPSLGVEGSAFHTAFLTEYRQKKATDSRFFDASDWPAKLADEVSSALLARASPVTVPAVKDYFTIGSTKDEVLAIQGTPDSLTESSFTYGFATVRFSRDRVATWSNIGGDLKVRLFPKSRVAAKSFFTIGSSKDEVLAVQGTPEILTDTSFTYGFATVRFTGDRVATWSNIGGTLKVRLTPASTVIRKEYFTIGSTKDEVLAVQGTPDSLTESSFTYGFATVRFSRDRVATRSNIGGNLKVNLSTTP